jgi:type II secretion system protein L
LEKSAIDEVRILLGAARASSAHDHVWCRSGDSVELAPRLLDELPPAERYLVIVPCQRASLFCVPMPPGPRRKVEEALPFLVEERLLEPVERYEVWPLWPAAAGAGDKLWLAVLERDWLAGVRAALGRIGSGEVRWVLAGWGWESGEVNIDAAAASAPMWQLRADGDGVTFNANGIDPRLLPLAGLAEFLALAWTQAAPAERPNELRFAVADAATAAGLEVFCKTHQISARALSLPDPLRADYDACPHSLLRQTRSPWRREWSALFSRTAWRRWRPAAYAALALLGLELAAPALSWGLLSIEQGRLQSEATALYRELAGAQATVVNPLLQMRRAFQNRRHADGKSAPDDFIPLLAGVSSVLPANLRQFSELAYDNARLRIVVPAAPGASLNSVSQTLRDAGWAVKASATSDNSRWTFIVSRP